MRIFVEAAGCLTANFLITAIKESGHECVASDANPQSIGKFLADDFCTVPMADADDYVEKVLEILIDKKIDMVIPSLDDALMKWAKMRYILEDNGICLALSESDALSICLDKWNTYQKFIAHGIPTPLSSLEQKYPLVKPRNGRGGSGILVTNDKVNMEGMISQELLVGMEYTIDVFCNINHEPIYIVPRKRLGIKDGKSTGGEVVNNPEIIAGIRKICSAIPLMGAVNIQCFDTDSGIKFTEINPRFGGGTVLGMKATENWIPLSIETFYKNKVVNTKVEPNFGLKMGRYYAEVFYK